MYTYFPPGSANAASQHVRLTWNKSTRRGKLVTAELLEQLAHSQGQVFNFDCHLERGHAYITYPSIEAATAALSALDGVSPEPLRGMKLRAEVWGGVEVTSADAKVVLSGSASASDDAGSADNGAAPSNKSTTLALTIPVPPSVSSTAVPAIPGLTVIHDFLSVQEEAALLRWMYRNDRSEGDASAISTSAEHSSAPLSSDGSSSADISSIDRSGGRWIGSGHLARRVQHFGQGFDYVNRMPMAAAAVAGAANSQSPLPSASSASAANAAEVHLASQIQPLPTTSPLADLCARIRDLGVLGDSAFHGWNHCRSDTVIQLKRWMPSLGSEPSAAGGAGSSISDSTASRQAAQGALLNAIDSAVRASGIDITGNGCSCTFKPSASAPASHGSASAHCTAGIDSSLFLAPDQVTANEYKPSQGISPHIDTHSGFQDGIVSASLGCDSVMEFVRHAPNPTQPPPQQQASSSSAANESSSSEALIDAGRLSPNGPNGSNFSNSSGTACSSASSAVGERHSVFLPRRSLLILRGEARYGWAHSIPGRKLDVIDGRVQAREGVRVSVTLRACRPIVTAAASAVGAPATDEASCSPSWATADVRRTPTKPAISPCTCNWPSVCFSQCGGSSRPSKLLSPRLQRLAAAAEGGVAPSAATGSSSSDVTSDSSLVAASATSSSLDSAAKTSSASASSSSASQRPLSSPIASASGSASSIAATPAIESRYVHSLYDTIAQHFSHTRYNAWPRVEAFVHSLPAGALVYDVGCGNGKYMGLRRDLAVVGCDRSPPLAEICGGRGFNACVGDALVVPFRRGLADAALSIAVLHHISTVERRRLLLLQLLECVRPDGGRIFVQAWAAEQGEGSRRDFRGGQDALVPWCLARR